MIDFIPLSDDALTNNCTTGATRSRVCSYDGDYGAT